MDLGETIKLAGACVFLEAAGEEFNVVFERFTHTVKILQKGLDLFRQVDRADLRCLFG